VPKTARPRTPDGLITGDIISQNTVSRDESAKPAFALETPGLALPGFPTIASAPLCWWEGDFATAMAGPRPCTARQASFVLADNSLRTVYSPK